LFRHRQQYIAARVKIGNCAAIALVQRDVPVSMVSRPPFAWRRARSHREVHENLLDLPGVGARHSHEGLRLVVSTTSSPINRTSIRSTSPTTALRLSTFGFDGLLVAEQQQLPGQRSRSHSRFVDLA
jgi:hypothetical protein